MDFTVADFHNRFPELVGLTDSQVQVIIDDCKLLTPQNRWLDLWTVGIANFVAHEFVIKLNQKNGDNNSMFPITSQGAGRVSMQQKTGDQTTDDDLYYQSTTYGQKYLNLKNIIGMGASLAGNYDDEFSVWPV